MVTLELFLLTRPESFLRGANKFVMDSDVQCVLDTGSDGRAACDLFCLDYHEPFGRDVGKWRGVGGMIN